jgi:hypothetical protein
MARANSVPPAADAHRRTYKLEMLLVSFAALLMEFGFRVVLLLGLALYLLVTLRGLLRLSSNGEPVPAQQLIPPEPAVVGASEGT